MVKTLNERIEGNLELVEEIFKDGIFQKTRLTIRGKNGEKKQDFYGQVQYSALGRYIILDQKIERNNLHQELFCNKNDIAYRVISNSRKKVN